MRRILGPLFHALIFILSSGVALAQCPERPDPGTVVQDPLSLSSRKGVLDAELTMRHSVDSGGYTHYCYDYKTDQGEVEAPTLRLNPGDTLVLDVKDRIEDPDATSQMGDMSGAPAATCGDTGRMTVSSTNVHFHGLNVPPLCHQDDVLTTLIQPNTPAFQFKMQIPTDEPPGLYWYHPHVHGFTEFQVNGGAAGAIVVEGMEKLRPEVAGLKQRVFIIRQQFLVPWVPGPYQLTLNYQVADYPRSKSPIIEMKPNEKQFWRVANATLQDFLQLEVLNDGKPQKLRLIALDGYPLRQPRDETLILLPPAGRAEFVVQAPAKGQSIIFYTEGYSTGPTGNPDFSQTLADINLTHDPGVVEAPTAEPPGSEVTEHLKFSDLAQQKATANRKLYFSEEFGGTGGPVQFYITVDGQKQKVFEPDEKPAITTNTGAVEDWTIENRAFETHAFHIHQIHFMVLEVDGKPVTNQDLRDTIEIPYWEGRGRPYHSVKLRMDFRDPKIAGTFVFHCHILLHEDLGMMHKILVMRKKE